MDQSLKRSQQEQCSAEGGKLAVMLIVGRWSLMGTLNIQGR